MSLDDIRKNLEDELKRLEGSDTQKRIEELRREIEELESTQNSELRRVRRALAALDPNVSPDEREGVRLTKDRRTALTKLANDKASVSDAAEAIGLSEEKVRILIKRYGSLKVDDDGVLSK